MISAFVNEKFARSTLSLDASIAAAIFAAVPCGVKDSRGNETPLKTSGASASCGAGARGAVWPCASVCGAAGGLSRSTGRACVHIQFQ